MKKMDTYRYLLGLVPLKKLGLEEREELIEDSLLPDEEVLEIVKNTLDNFGKLWKAYCSPKKNTPSKFYHDRILIKFINRRMSFLTTLGELSKLKPSLDLMDDPLDSTFFALLLSKFSLKTLHEWDPNWLRKIIGPRGILWGMKLQREEDLETVLSCYPQLANEVVLSDTLLSRLIALDSLPSDRFSTRGEGFIDHYLARLSYYRISQLSPDCSDRYRAALLKHGRGQGNNLWHFPDLNDEEKAVAIRDTISASPSFLGNIIKGHTFTLGHIKASQRPLDEQIKFAHLLLDKKIEFELPGEEEESLWLLPALLEGNPEAKRLVGRLKYQRRCSRNNSLQERKTPEGPPFNCRSALWARGDINFFLTVMKIKGQLLQDGRKDLIFSLENLLIFLRRRANAGEKLPYTGLISREIVGYFPQEWQKMIKRWVQRANKEANSEGIRT